MKAISVSDYFSGYEDIEEADELVKSVEKKAIYMKKLNIGTLLFIPLEPIKECQDSFVYEINNVLYDTLWTNKYEQLVKLHERRKEKSTIEQMTIFDF